MVRTAASYSAALRAIAIPLGETTAGGRTKYMNLQHSAALKKNRVKRGTSNQNQKKGLPGCPDRPPSN
jgi:hypothetical protein